MARNAHDERAKRTRSLRHSFATGITHALSFLKSNGRHDMFWMYLLIFRADLCVEFYYGFVRRFGLWIGAWNFLAGRCTNVIVAAAPFREHISASQPAAQQRCCDGIAYGRRELLRCSCPTTAFHNQCNRRSKFMHCGRTLKYTSLAGTRILISVSNLSQVC